jgi:hypothetical protein
MSGLWTWFKLLFTSKIGSLIKILLLKSATTIASQILNKENQEKAYEFVKELNSRTDITNTEKAVLFNDQMSSWAKAMGKTLTTSIINCLRELAVNALKCEVSE